MSVSGKIIVITAPSGSGKTTLTSKLMQEFTDMRFSVSVTTRKPRNGEKDGVDYFFRTPEEFKKMISEGLFLEYQQFYNGTLYGTLKEYVDKLLKSGYFVVLDIEVKGALNVKNIYGDDSLCVFIQPPSTEILKQRLINRGTESEESLKLRMERVSMELKYSEKFDFVIVNDDIDRAYQELKLIVGDFKKQHNHT